MILIPFLLSPLSFFGQQDGKFIDQSQDRRFPFTVTKYGTKHGLPQNQVIDMTVRRNGSLIISTSNGIVEYNGTEFSPVIASKSYKKQPLDRLLYHGPTNGLFGTEKGIDFKSLMPRFRQLAKLRASDLSGDHIIGVDSNGKLFRRHVKGTCFEPLFDTHIREAVYLYVDGTRCYISNRSTLFCVNLKTGRKQIVLSDIVCRIRRNPFTGKLYATSFSKPELYQLLAEKAVKVSLGLKPAQKKELLLTDIAFIDADTWYISSSNGLILKNASGTTVFGADCSLTYLQVLYFNREENCLFAGSALDGLFKLELKSCSGLFDIPGIGQSSMGSVIRTHSGITLATGSWGIVFAIGPNGASEYFRSPLFVTSLAEIDGVIYIGTWGMGALMVKDRKLIGTIRAPQLGDNDVHAVFKGTRGRMWIGTDSGISVGRDPASVKPFLPGKITECITSIYQLRNGTICAGGGSHVYFIAPSGRLLGTLSEKNGLICKEPRSFYEDKSGKLWIGTYDGGLYCWYRHKLTSINRMPYCYLGPDAFTIAPDAKGNLLMTSNKGLWSISERKLNDFYYHRLPYLVPLHFSEESGIMSTEFNGGSLNHYYRAPSDTFYFPTIQGLAIKFPSRLKFRKLHPAFGPVSVNDTLYTGKKDHRLERTTHTIRFSFFCTGYSGKFNTYYQYRLTGPGLPDRWSVLQKDGNVSFKMLPPGQYIFSVRAIDGFNDSSPLVRKYAFTISPWFYETAWFRVIVIVLLILFIVSILRFRYQRSLTRAQRENKINQTILELKLKAIQSKMDPHFIFNALNNIIYLLNAGKHQEAEELVHDFSLLLRRFLEKSDSIFLSLDEELTIIDLYLHIEQKRYNRQFDYRIDIDETIRNKEIPTLLIQPLVENAIKHGISHTDRPCFIRIAVFRTEAGIAITIEDNGIGLEEAVRINQNRKNHVSKGLSLVREKIAIMREKYGIEIGLEVLDLGEGERTGTLSRLNIVFHD